MIISRDIHCKNIQFNNGKDICRSNTTNKSTSTDNNSIFILLSHKSSHVVVLLDSSNRINVFACTVSLIFACGAPVLPPASYILLADAYARRGVL